MKQTLDEEGSRSVLCQQTKKAQNQLDGRVRTMRRKNFCRPLPFFASMSTISRFGERFRDGQYSFASFLFAVLLTVSPVSSHL